MSCSVEKVLAHREMLGLCLVLHYKRLLLLWIGTISLKPDLAWQIIEGANENHIGKLKNKKGKKKILKTPSGFNHKVFLILEQGYEKSQILFYGLLPKIATKVPAISTITSITVWLSYFAAASNLPHSLNLLKNTMFVYMNCMFSLCRCGLPSGSLTLNVIWNRYESYVTSTLLCHGEAQLQVFSAEKLKVHKYILPTNYPGL